MKFFVTTMLLLSMNYAQADCENLNTQLVLKCSASEFECNNLGTCVFRRRSCPGSFNSKKSCQALSECMGDHSALASVKPDYISSYYLKKPCEYKWQPNKKCRLPLSEIGWESPRTCPGRWFEDTSKDDTKFNCSSHRKLAIDANKHCKTALELYTKKCKDTANFNPTHKKAGCTSLDKYPFPSDTEHQGNSSVFNKMRHNSNKSIPKDDEGSSGSNNNDSVGK